MTDHHPLCLWPKGGTACQCNLIARVAEEVAKAIEDARDGDRFMITFGALGSAAMTEAARIAREAGRPDLGPDSKEVRQWERTRGLTAN